MTRTIAGRAVAVALLAAMLVFSGARAAMAETDIDTGGKLYLGISGEFGYGLHPYDLGTNENNETVDISMGGGVGISLVAGLGLSRSLDVEVSAGHQLSKLKPAVTNAEVTFEREFVLGTLKWKIPLSRTSQMKFGAGMGYYMGGTYDFNHFTSQSVAIITYDDAVGYHVTAEYEGIYRKYLGVSIGLKAYSVTYEATSFMESGTFTPTSEHLADFIEPDGSGVDLIVTVTRYFF